MSAPLPPSSGFICKTCGQAHSGVPDFGFRRPDAIIALDKKTRERCFETDDGCAIPPSTKGGPDARFFVRCVLSIPLTDGPGDPPQEDFAFGPWAEVSQPDYEAAMEQTEGEILAPFPGLLANELPGYPDSRGLKVTVDPADGSNRPMLTCEAKRHPLALAQRTGISTHNALALLEDRD